MSTTLTLRTESIPSTNGQAWIDRLCWHRCTPQEITRAANWSDGSPGWAAWRKHLSVRREPSPPEAFVGRRSSLLWAFPDELRGTDAESLIAELHGLRRKRGDGELLEGQIHAWLAESAGAAAETGYALECLAWCHTLPKLADVVPAQSWWELLGRLTDTAQQAVAIDLNRDPLPHQLLAGELALTLAWQLPEIQLCRNLIAQAKRQLSAGLDELLDGDGLPHCRHLDKLRPWMACWTRCRAIGEGQKGGCWNRHAQGQYGLVVRQALRLARYDGSQSLTAEKASGWDAQLFAAALRYGGDRVDDRIAAIALPPGLAKTNGRAGGKLPSAAENSPWSSLAVLRSDWKRNSPMLVVAYGGSSFVAELSCGSEMILSGFWSPEIRSDGRKVEPAGDWDCVCWESDHDMDYLELALDLTGGLRLERQMLLARDDQFLFAADAVFADEPSSALDYRLRLPLANGMAVHRSKETREVFLSGQRRRARVLPLALNEWKSDARGGFFGCEKDGLELHLSGQGRGLYAPLFFDLNPRRFNRQLTWRRLTVAEDLKIQPSDQAVGYRVQIGREQWVIYRSLSGKASRTLLGINIFNEFALGRFDRSGEMEPMLEVE